MTLPLISTPDTSTWDQTSLIGKIFIAFGALLTIGVLEWQGRRQYLLALAVTLAGAEASVQLVKHAVGRARPDPLLAYYIEPTFSFPSTHTTLATAFYGFLAYAIMQEAKDPAQRRLGLSAAFLMVLIFGTMLASVGTAVGGVVILAAERPAVHDWLRQHRLLGGFLTLLAAVPLGALMMLGTACGFGLIGGLWTSLRR